MSTLADIKARIIAELIRDDLEDDLAGQLLTHIQAACRHYAPERFWFNAIITTATTTQGDRNVTLPATMQRVQRVTLPQYYRELYETDLPYFEVPGNVVQSIPQWYTYYNDQIRLHPIPAGEYTLQVTGVKRIDPPEEDTDSNEWTTEAQDLIVAHAKATLSRDQFRDPEGYKMFAGAAQEHFSRLQRETALRLVSRLAPRDGHWRRSAFDWRAG